MPRLADYCLVVGYDPSNEAALLPGHPLKSVLLQRFPAEDWDDVKLPPSVEAFCQPIGWEVSTRCRQPTFHQLVLTDSYGRLSYGACLTFYEPPSIPPRAALDSYISKDYDGRSCAASVNGSVFGSAADLEAGQAMDEFYGVDIVSAERPHVFVPKCLVIISTLDLKHVFKNCLSVIYSAYIERQASAGALESIIGNLLGGVFVPPPGGSIVRFSISGDDRQAVQPPQSESIPVTGNCVYRLLKDIGIRNTITLVTAALIEQRILFRSSSLNCLMDGCKALSALLYPFVFRLTFIPLLPVDTLLALESPSPYIIGVHNSIFQSPLMEEVSCLDTIQVDLDGGAVNVPEHMKIPVIPEHTLARTMRSLNMILNPGLLTSDLAFPTSPIKGNAPESIKSEESSSDYIDKQIRAVFIRMFAELLFGYRSCLVVLRIHPQPVIEFQQTKFLTCRSMTEDELMLRLVETINFKAFIHDRGLPYRVCDIFDTIVANIFMVLRDEDELEAELQREGIIGNEKAMNHIREIAMELFHNENPHVPFQTEVRAPADTTGCRQLQQSFPLLNASAVQRAIEEACVRQAKERHKFEPPAPVYKIVPFGVRLTNDVTVVALHLPRSQRLQVLRNLMALIFDGKDSEARKILNAVERSLKTKTARQMLASELVAYAKDNQNSDMDQKHFELLVRLVNYALKMEQDESGTSKPVFDESGIAATVFTIGERFNRKLPSGFFQSLYYSVQEPRIWSSINFWVSLFYKEVESDIRRIYESDYQHTSAWPRIGRDSITSPPPLSPSIQSLVGARRPPIVDQAHQLSCLEICAEEMRKRNSRQEADESRVQQSQQREQEAIFAFAQHFAYNITKLHVPLEKAKRLQMCLRAGDVHRPDGDNVSASNSAADSDASLNESGYDEQATDDGDNTAKFEDINICRFLVEFIDRVCSVAEIGHQRISQLKMKIPQLISTHIETLDCVNEAANLLPPVERPKILKPKLLRDEEILFKELRCFLLVDGREEFGLQLTGQASLVVSANQTAPSAIGLSALSCLLPAEGALFITNYRLIFKGTSCDPLATEQVIMRAFPISSLVKHKAFRETVHLMHVDHFVHNVIHFRSNIFQFMRIAYDADEVSEEDLVGFYGALNERWRPQSQLDSFAFAGCQLDLQSILEAEGNRKQKTMTFGRAAAKFVGRTARNVGLKSKPKKPKPVRPLRPAAPRAATLGAQRFEPPDHSAGSSHTLTAERPASAAWDADHCLAIGADSTFMAHRDLPATFNDLPLAVDYRRITQSCDGPLHTEDGDSIQLSSDSEYYVTSVNDHYTICATYPSMLMVAPTASKESLMRLAHAFKQCRFPVVVWRHSRTRAALIRAAAFNTKGFMSLLKSDKLAADKHPTEPRIEGFIECEKYFRAVADCTPLSKMRSRSDSISSLSSSVSGMSSISSSQHQSALGTSNRLGMFETPGAERKHLSGSHGLSGTLGRSSKTMLSQLKGAFGGSKSAASFTPANSLDGGVSAGAAPECDGVSMKSRADCSTVGSMSIGSFTPTRSKRSIFKQTLDHLRDPSVKGVRTRNRGGSGKFGAIGNSFTMSNKASRLTKGGDRLLTAGADSPDSGAADRLSNHLLHKAPVYILVDKAQVKQLKTQLPCKLWEFIPVEATCAKDIRNCFKELRRACIPSRPPGVNYRFAKAVEDTGWLDQIQLLLQLAGAIVDLVESQASSVMVCLEDGWDFTAQLTSLAELMLDPAYRTFSGFKTLVEKEWLAFGHRFSYRSVQTEPIRALAHGYSPIFLQWLDCVHQMLHQFPMAFEFNDFYLKFIAYHHLSNRFPTFMFDSENERHNHSLLLQPPDGSESLLKMTMSVWDFVEKVNHDRPLFYNFCYFPHEDSTTLRPLCRPSNLVIWDFYTDEFLADAPAYDVDLALMELKASEEQNDTIGTLERRRPRNSAFQQSTRRVINPSLHNISLVSVDAFTDLFMKIGALANDLKELKPLSETTYQRSTLTNASRSAQRTKSFDWRELWTEITEAVQSELPLAADTMWPQQSALNSVNSAQRMVRHQSNYLHKKCTLEILLRGKLSESDQAPPAMQHTFERFASPLPNLCDHCQRLLHAQLYTPGHPQSFTPGMICTECGFKVHDQCLGFVKQSCTGGRKGAAGGPGHKAARSSLVGPPAAAPAGGARATGSPPAAQARHSSLMPKAPELPPAAALPAQQRYPASVSPEPHLMLSSSHEHDLAAQLSARSTPSLLGSPVSDNVPMSGNTEPLPAARERGLAFKGELWKQSHRFKSLKAWKRRYFVLDAAKHEIRYYESETADSVRGQIQLSDVLYVRVSAGSGSSLLAGAPKGADESHFFELKTQARTFHFLAPSAQHAIDWVDKIHPLLS